MKLLAHFRHRNQGLIALCSLFAVFAIIIGLNFFAFKERLPVAIETRQQSTLRAGEVIAIRAFHPLSSFAYEQIDGKQFTNFIVVIKDKNDQTFIVAMRVRPEDVSTILEHLAAQDNQVWISDMEFYGRLENISSAASVYFNDTLTRIVEDDGLPIVRLVLNATAGNYVSTKANQPVLGGILMGLGSVVGLYAIFVISGLTQRQVHRIAKRLAFGGSARLWLDDFAEKASYLEGVYVNPEAILYDNYGISRLVPTHEVVWVYSEMQRHQLKTGGWDLKVFKVILKTSDKKTHRMVFRSYNQANAVCDALKERFPTVIIGYSPALEAIYDRNPAGFIAAVNDVAV